MVILLQLLHYLFSTKLFSILNFLCVAFLFQNSLKSLNPSSCSPKLIALFALINKHINPCRYVMVIVSCGAH